MKLCGGVFFIVIISSDVRFFIVWVLYLMGLDDLGYKVFVKVGD